MLKRSLACLLLLSILTTLGCGNVNSNEQMNNNVQTSTIGGNELDVEIETIEQDVLNTEDTGLTGGEVSSDIIIIENTTEENITTLSELSDNSVTYTKELETEESLSDNNLEITDVSEIDKSNYIEIEQISETDKISEEVKLDYTFPFDSTRDTSKLFLNNQPAKPFILDVDMNTDVDDVCAVRMATALDDLGVIDLKAVCYCTDYSSYGALRGILHHDGKDDVLMGQGTEDRHEGSPYWNELGKHNDFGGNWESSVRQYRKVLASAESPVDIVTTGQVTNLEALLKSGPDDISPLTGKELVMTKVGQLYITGGDYPDGWSNNLALTNAATIATKYVSQNWGLPIIWSPGNHSGKLTCGKYLQDLDVYRKDPVTRALDAWGVSAGRAAWDPFAVWVAGYACNEVNQVSLTQCSFGIQDGGANWFKEDPNGDDYVLNLTNTDLNYYNQIMDNHLIYIFSRLYGVENPNKEPIGLETIK